MNQPTTRAARALLDSIRTGQSSTQTRPTTPSARRKPRTVRMTPAALAALLSPLAGQKKSPDSPGAGCPVSSKTL
jgi:hypothetical protein